MTREDELMKKAKEGDDGALEELIRLYYPEILRYCLWHAPDRETAQDAAQETFLKAVRYFDNYVHKGRFRPFLYKIAANTCVDMRRKEHDTELSLDELADRAAVIDAGLNHSIDRIQLEQLLSCLSKQDRELVILRFGNDLTLKETAQAAGLTLRGAQSRLRRALALIRKQWKEDF